MPVFLFAFFLFLPETLRRGERELSELISSMFVELVEVEVKERRKKKNESIAGKYKSEKKTEKFVVIFRIGEEKRRRRRRRRRNTKRAKVHAYILTKSMR